MIFLIHFPTAFSNAFLTLLRCIKIVLPLPKNTKQAETLTFIRLSFACSLPDSTQLPPVFPPVFRHVQLPAFRLFSAGFDTPSSSVFFRLSVSLLLSSLSTLLFFQPYKMMQTIPPLLSFTIFCIVSCSFIWHSSSIIEILPRMPSSISSPMDFPKILVSHAPSSLFSPSLI